MFSAIVLVFVLATGEAAARMLDVRIPEWQLDDAQGVVMVGHPTRLWAVGVGERRYGPHTIHVNPLGLRGEPPVTPKPPGRPRVLVLGDSTWFGHGVADEETFGEQVEARFAESGVDVEVLNGGIPGYSTAQTALLMEELGWDLDPDLLLVGSLWSDNNADWFADEDLLRTARQNAYNPLFRSHLFRMLATAVDRARGGAGARLVTWTKDSQPAATGARRVPVRSYAANLDRLARDAAARGVGVAFVAPSNVLMVEDRVPGGAASWDPYFDAQRAVAAHHGVVWAETLPAMRAARAGAPSAEALFVDQMHPSAEGHRVFAQVAADALRAAGWPEAPQLARGGAFDPDTLPPPRGPTPALGGNSPQQNLFVGAEAPRPE